MRRARPGIGPEPVPSRTSLVPLAFLRAAFTRVAAASISSAHAVMGAAVTAAKVGTAAMAASKLRRETGCLVFNIVRSPRSVQLSSREATGDRVDYLGGALQCHHRSPLRTLGLCDADAGHRDLLEQVW